MRLADVLIDLAVVASASRSVASKHIALRSRQLDRYSKTSSIAAGLQKATPAPAARPDRGAPAPEKPAPARSAEEAAETPATDATRSDHPRAALQDAHKSLGDGRAPAPWATREGTFSMRRAPPRSLASKFVESRKETEVGVDQDIPEGININVFQTSRGSRSREVDEDAARQATRQATPVRQAALTTAPPRPTEDTHSQTRPDATSPDRAAPTVDGEPTIAPTSSASPAPEAVSSPSQLTPSIPELTPTSGYQLRESKVPATRLGRIWNYGGLAAGMLGGAISESISRGFGGVGEGSALLSPANMERLVTKLSRMRGAALKMGQMLSFQDAKMLPGPIRDVLQRVQDRADYMPAWQRDRVLAANLGPEWRDLFESFEEKPIAAASIGQVHRAALKAAAAGTEEPQQVAVKIQFPGVADSINSDLDNLAMLLAATKLLPKGLYLDKTIANARTELAWECDYEREAECVRRYKNLLSGDGDAAVFAVPRVFGAASGRQVLTMEFMSGVGVTRGLGSFNQEQRDRIGTHILRLCLREITEFRFMQTDPNWTNFLYNAETGKLELLDFGASREYPEHFVALYVRLLYAASRGDREGVKTLSEELGYLTGHESRTMLDAHTQSVLTLAEPFLESAPDVYDFSDQTITERVKSFIPVMVKERLAPPPEETYSLHRKLSGAFLLCARLGSKVRCREMFSESVRKSKLVPGFE